MTQKELYLPISIVYEIISFSDAITQCYFRTTCKLFCDFVDRFVFPTTTTTLKPKSEYYQVFLSPTFGALDALSQYLYIADRDRHIVQKINLKQGTVSKLCGSLGVKGYSEGTDGLVNQPSGIAVNDEKGVVYVADEQNNVINEVEILTGEVTILAGRAKGYGSWNLPSFRIPLGITYDSTSKTLYVADNSNHTIKKVLVESREVETLCGVGVSGYVDGSFAEAKFSFPFDVTFNPSTQELYVADNGNVVRRVSLLHKTVSTLCQVPKFPRGIGLDRKNDCVYVSGTDSVIYKVNLSGDVISIPLCGELNHSGSKDGVHPTFNYPIGVLVDPHSRDIYVIDKGNHRIRKIVDTRRKL